MNQEFLRKIYDKMSPETQVKAKKIVKKYGKRKTESVDTKKKVPEFVPAKLKKADDITVAAIFEQDCCGCGVCAEICPQNAIQMETDAEGYVYPQIDTDKCVKCGKCLKHCPAVQVKYENSKEPESYVMMAEDEIRRKGSAGGCFTLLSNIILESGGYVCGAAYKNGTSVEHVLIRKKEDLDQIHNIKYVKSDIRAVCPEIEKLLKKGKTVLFSGVPCDVAALYAFLGQEYENLITVDIFCHGLPSQEMFERYLKDSFPDKEVESVKFRNRGAFGWANTISVYFKDGTSFFERSSTNAYLRAMFIGLSRRPACSSCRFLAIPRQADISLGDFWEAGDIKREYSDGIGTSAVLVNSEKGKKLFEVVKTRMKMVQNIELSKLLDKSRREGEINKPNGAHPSRKRFFQLLETSSFKRATEYSLRGKYDIGIIGLWYGRNYGSMVTYYALHHELTSMGLSVLMINNPLSREGDTMTKTDPRRFAREHYNISPIYPMHKLKKFNDLCDGFIVGSDQLWNYGLSRIYGQYYFLNFADDNKKKIAYGTSFGKSEYRGPEPYRELSAYYLQRFDAVSVREEFAIEMCKNVFGVDATWVTDTVFFCKKNQYAEIENVRPECAEGPYILAYILDPTKEKTEALLNVSKRMNKKVKVILDEAPGQRERNRQNMRIPAGAPIEILNEVDLPEWLYCFDHSDYVVTDSFHGTCFAIIFQKNFSAISNKKRGSLRFASLLGGFGLLDRLTEDATTIIGHPMVEEPIDYVKTEQLIDAQVEKSREWLRNAVFSEKKVDNFTVFPMVDKRR